MEEELKPRFRVVKTIRAEDFEEKVNALVDVGYKPRNVVMEPDFYRALLSLDNSDLSEAVDMVRIELDTNQESTPLLAKMLSEGWAITSEYSKAVQLMKVKQND